MFIYSHLLVLIKVLLIWGYSTKKYLLLWGKFTIAMVKKVLMSYAKLHIKGKTLQLKVRVICSYSLLSPYSTSDCKMKLSSTTSICKKSAFRMLLWLCAYYKFFDKKVLYNIFHLSNKHAKFMILISFLYSATLNTWQMQLLMA